MSSRKSSLTSCRGLIAVVAFVLMVAGGLLVNSPISSAKATYSPPNISCAGSGTDYIDIQVCGSRSGAPAGISVQWKLKSDYDLNGWAQGDSYCAASFSGNANDSRYNLAPGECVTVRIGEILLDSGASTDCPEQRLLCGQDYVFRAFAHGDSAGNRSAFTANLTCSTLDCDEGCDPNVKSHGFWAQHFPAGWPAEVITNGLDVCGTHYTAQALEDILNQNPNQLACAQLWHQVINVYLNIANGASQAYIDATADDLAAACTFLNGGDGDCGTLTLALDTTRAEFECADVPE